MNASQILELLAQKHSKDLFVPECKDGSTVFGTHMRLDAWAMKRSWSNPCYWGYEIKVSRHDFLKDDKWPAYLKLCNCFSFVCPSGMLKVDEMSRDCGLIWTSKSGARLFTKKKAPYRQIEEPTDLLIYILMCRSAIDAEYRIREGHPEYWRQWLETKKENREIGYEVARALRQKYAEDVTRVQTENERLKSHVEDLENVKTWIRDLDLNPDDVSNWGFKNNFKHRIKTMQSLLPEGFEQRIEDAKTCLETVLSEIKRLTAPPE
jgi:hypothetical protein